MPHWIIFKDIRLAHFQGHPTFLSRELGVCNVESWRLLFHQGVTGDLTFAKSLYFFQLGLISTTVVMCAQYL